MKPIIFLSMLLILSACTPADTIVYVNNTEIRETVEIIYINKTINLTEECSEKYSQEYVNLILRDYNSCRHEMTFLNNTEMADEYYDLNISLSRCEAKLEEIENALG